MFRVGAHVSMTDGFAAAVEREGEVGVDGFRRLVSHDPLGDKPMVVETPTNGRGCAWNIERVRERLTGSRPRARPRADAFRTVAGRLSTW
ncbi:hypothetical protein [Halorubellus salinus]|uniref:hypothetical protein n=1 Tax=Halorubellus salinus TaxID=755309 RepID=UPI003F62C9D8